MLGRLGARRQTIAEPRRRVAIAPDHRINRIFLAEDHRGPRDEAEREEASSILQARRLARRRLPGGDPARRRDGADR